MATSPLSEVVQHLRRTVFLRDDTGLTDGQLMDRFISRRETAALAALARRHGAMVWGVCRRVLRNHHDAEDAFQATFLVLVRKAASIASPELLANWLYGVAHQTALKARATAGKRRQRERQVKEMPEPAVTAPDLWHDLQPVLDQELSHLPDKYRTAVVLCDLEGKTRREAARQLNVPDGTLAARLARGRAMLAKRLARHGLAVSGGALAAALAQDAASAVAPTSLVFSTINAAACVAAGQAAPAVVSPKVAALTEGMVRTMMLTKAKFAAGILVLAILACYGVGVLTHPAAVAGQAEAVRKGEPKAAPTWKEGATMPYEGALYVFSVALSPDGKTLATGINHFDPSRSGEVALWDTATGKVRTVLEGHTELVQSLAFSPDGKRLASASHDKTVKVWDTATGKEVRSFAVTDDRGCAMSVTFSPDGKTLAVGYAKGPGDEGVKLMEVATGTEVGSLAGFRAAFSPDGKMVATGTIDGVLRLWEVATSKELNSAEAHGGPVTYLAFSPDGKTLATVSNADDTVRLWDVATAKRRAALEQATFSVNSLAFSPDGKSLAVGSHEKDGEKVSGLVILWDAATGKRQVTLPVDNGPVTAVAFASKDGRTLAAASYSALPGGDIANFSKGITKVVLTVWDFR
jgi:RNA polymerase sigma factor (sigma-70 family)